ncbi:MAG: amidohydrolase family protein [Clostridiales Family XIII bacterium]|jgi:hypothetical protein|nr:amidohydrolase family protein [Clostridiales Family XIII bacterium]
MTEIHRILDSHAHIGDIFHGSGNVTFKTGVVKSVYDDPFAACEKSGYAQPLIPEDPDDLIRAGKRRSEEWTLENLTAELDRQTCPVYAVMLPIWPNQTFEEYLAASKLEPRIIPFTSCALDMPIREMADKLRRDIERGAKGLKLHPTIQNTPLDDPKISAAMEVFRAADLPVVTHCGDNPYYTADSPYSRLTTPAYSAFDEVIAFCRRWPDVKIVVAHCCGYAERLFEAAQGLRNVYTDTTMCSAEKMKQAVERFGAERILFGSDVPFGSLGPSIAELKKAFAGDAVAADRVAFENMAELIGFAD